MIKFARKITKAWRDPELALLLALRWIYNSIFSPQGRARFTPSGLAELDEVQRRATIRTDFSDHLVTLFVEAWSGRPKLIVELGTRGGDSTFVLERVAKLCGAKFISVDIVDCKNVSRYPEWAFIQGDDIEVARNFKRWCADRSLDPRIDVLFIDTSHEFDHTVRELAGWLPFLSETGKVIFHDTNLRRIYFRKDGSMDIGWRNRRGVIRALEQYFHQAFSENRDFIDVRSGWLIKHWARCSGFTVLEKLPRTIAAAGV